MDNAFEAREYLAAIVASSDDAIISKDLHGNITSWNAAAERIFGYAAEDAVGKHISMIIPPEFLFEEDYILSQIKAGRRIDHFETVRRRKDGVRIDVAVTISPIQDHTGTVIGASKIARDITEAKASERLGAYHKAIVDSSDDAIISKDLNGVITSWNASAERILGYRAEEIIGRPITDIIPADRLPEEEKIMAFLKAGRRVEHIETLRRHKDGHLVPLSVTISPMLDSANNIIGASKVARDNSERHKIEALLKEMGRKKDEFIANVSHELRTPMNAVIGLAHLLSRSTTLSKQDKKFVDTLKLSADNLMELISDLLDFAKIKSSSIQLEEVEFNLLELVENAVQILNVKAQEKNLTLSVNYELQFISFLGDPIRLNQILMNLLSNAIKFTDKGSIEVNVAGKINDGEGTSTLTLKVRDTGIGIASDKQEAIFEKFTQADASRSRRYGGSGLGLAISKALVELMGGCISLESQLDLGSTFTVVIPLKNLESLAAANPPNFYRKPVLHKQVLLVEDYEASVLVATEMLKHFGYDYEVARNGYEALQKFSRGKFDIILMDVQMHGLDGIETTRRIRNLERERGQKPTTIVAMTAHVREQDKNLCLEAGMDDFIPKPFDPSLLADMLGLYSDPKTVVNKQAAIL